MLSFSAGRYVEGALAAQRARDSWNGAEAKAAVALARSGNPVARGKTGLTTGRRWRDWSFRASISTRSFSRVRDELNAGPGHVAGSAFPGGAGNAIISGERDRHFSHLDAVNPGDTVVTESGVGWLAIPGS